MRAGLLRHRISIEQRTETQDMAAGDQSAVWTPYIRADWARLTPKSGVSSASGRENVYAGAIQNATLFEVEMRYRPGITAGMRLKYIDRGAARYFNIVSPPRNMEEHGERMIFEAVEGFSNG